MPLTTSAKTFKVGFVLMCLVITLCTYFRATWNMRDIRSVEQNEAVFTPRPTRNISAKHDKWIVVTSIQSPTKDVIATAQIPGWKTLVVGDKKSPPNWRTPGVVYLDIPAQEALGYRIQKLLPYNTYTRKNIGYLYAIENGARFIYETDDDNYATDGLRGFHTTNNLGDGLVAESKNSIYNPYAHFGQSTIWPRGYPLENIGDGINHQYKLCNIDTPVIQQGLVNREPDLDAIFRLTRQHSGPPTNLRFDSSAPLVVLPGGTFSPFNSQNTLFTYDAFWALLLPTTVTDRASDIFRSYWAQRLIWLLSKNLAFYPPVTEQYRNSHSYIKDFQDEIQLYLYSGKLVAFLDKWICSYQDFFDCVSALTNDMVSAEFLKIEDARIVTAWLQDLIDVGYKPPPMKQSTTCKYDDIFNVTFYAREKITTLPHSRKLRVPLDTASTNVVSQFLNNTCGVENAVKWTDSLLRMPVTYTDILLIVSVKNIDKIPAMDALYRRYFPSILYCIETHTNSNLQSVLSDMRVSILSLSSLSSLACVVHAAKMNYRVKGFLHITETMLLQSKNLINKNRETIWSTIDYVMSHDDRRHICPPNSSVCLVLNNNSIHEMQSHIASTDLNGQFQKCFSTIFAEMSINNEIMFLRDQAFYIPTARINTLQKLNDSFKNKFHQLSYDIVSIFLLRCVESSPDNLQFNTLAANVDATAVDFIFPFQFMSFSQLRPNRYTDIVSHRDHFCQQTSTV